MSSVNAIVSRLAAEMKEKVVDHKYICAIDFGSATTGYSFLQRGDKNQVIRYQEWEGGSSKTETAVVLDEGGEVKWFGTEATRKYVTLTAQQEHNNYLYFGRFKMTLFKTEGRHLNLDFEISATDGRKMRAWEVISKMLIYLRDHFIRRIKRTAKITLQPDQVLWVLTVPAIWGNGAKQLMRHAAEQAKLCSEEEPHRLRLVLEPEAAGIFCTNLDLSRFVDGNKEHAAFSSDAEPEAARIGVEPGNKLLVVDCGGGTVDVSVLKKTADNNFVICAAPSGGPWGGNVVSEGVWEVVADAAGRETAEEWRREDPENYLELRSTIESKKQVWDKESSFAFNVPASLLEALHNKRVDLEHSVRETGQRLGHEIQFMSGRMILGSTLMQSIFDRSIQPIKRHIEDMATQGLLRGVVVALIVGGFANSCVLQRHVTDMIKKLDGSIDVLVPLEASASIMKGAVHLTSLWTCGRPVVKSRVSEKTYGIACSRPWNPYTHEGREWFMSYGKKYCNAVFGTMVTRGQTVEVGHEVRKPVRYIESCEKTTTAYTLVYSSRAESVEFIDDPGCELEAVIPIEITPPSKDNRTEEVVVMVFGDTEIKAIVVDNDSGKSGSAKIDFLCKAVSENIK